MANDKDFFDKLDEMEENHTGSDVVSPFVSEAPTPTKSDTISVDEASASSGSAGQVQQQLSPSAKQTPEKTRHRAMMQRVVRGCLGCKRRFTLDMCFVNEDSLVPWMHKDGSGQWCTPCVAVFRIMHWSTYPSLVLFESVFLADSKNFVRWTYECIAYASLAREGNGCIRAGDIMNRSDHIKWILKMLNLPISPWVIMTLTEAVPDRGLAAIDPSRLVTLRSPSNGDCLAVILEEGERDETHMLERPRPAEGVAHMPEMNLLQSANREDAAILSQMATGKSNPETCATLVVYQSAAEVVKTPMVIKTEAMLKLAKEVLVVFSKGSWTKTLESSLKQPRQKIIAHAADVNALGDTELMPVMERWSKGMTNAKTFLKHYRDYQKAKYSNQKLISFGAIVTETITFFDKEGILVAHSLRLLGLKVKFLETIISGKETGMTKPVEAMRQALNVSNPRS